MDWLKQNKIELIFIILTGFLVNIFLYIDIQGFFITFWDTDDFMRLVRIRQFFVDYDFLNNTIQRSNVPFGCELHWTRLYDFFLIIPSYFFNFFTDSIENAIEYVGFLITPFFKCAASVMIYAILLKCLEKYNAFLVAILFIGCLEIMPLGMFGRPDHHMFIIFLVTLFLWSVQRAISENDQNSSAEKNFYCISVTSFACIWASPETLIPLLLTDFVLFAHFFFSQDSEKLQLLFKKNIFVALLAGLLELTTARAGVAYLGCLDVLLIVSLLIGNSKKTDILLSVLFVCIILFSKYIFPIDYDKISIVHVVLYAISGIFFRISTYIRGDLKKRLILNGLFWIFLGVIFLILYPKFIYGMSADVSDYAKEIWLNRVMEMKSPLKDSDRSIFITHCIISFSAIFHGLFVLKFGEHKIFWHVISINAFFYTIFSGFAFRMWPFSDLFTLPIIVNSVMHAKILQKIPRIGKTCILLLLLTLLPPIFQKDKNELKQSTIENNSSKNRDENEEGKFKRKFYEEISKIVPPDSVIIADTDLGPEILYYTSCRVVGAPYHRQTEGIISCYEVLQKDYDENCIRKILEQTHASYILFEKPAPKSSEKNLKNMMANNELPKWLEILKLQSSDKMILAKII